MVWGSVFGAGNVLKCIKFQKATKTTHLAELDLGGNSRYIVCEIYLPKISYEIFLRKISCEIFYTFFKFVFGNFRRFETIFSPKKHHFPACRCGGQNPKISYAKQP